jgi:nitroreductase
MEINQLKYSNMIRKAIAGVVLTTIMMSSNAQVINLPANDTKGGLTLMESLSNRASTREFSSQELSEKTLSNLLWAAGGINRADSKKLTSPTAMNKQEISIYVFTKEYTALYDNKSHSLRVIASGDNRALVAGGQEFVKTAPVSLVLVGDLDKFGNSDPQSRQMVAADAGIVCQNINLFCAGMGLVTVPRAMMDVQGIQKLLKLNANQIPILNNPVGYKK